MQSLLDINDINVSIGGILLALSVVMFMIPIPCAVRWKNIRDGRNTLASAYVVLGGLMIVNGVIDSDAGSGLSGMITLVVAFFQALLYTRICILFLKPQSFDGAHYRILLTAFSLFSMGMAISYVVNQSVFSWLFYVGLAIYTLLLIYCCVAFTRNYNETLKRLEYVYDEDMHYSVSWVKGCFYSALLVGVMAWFMVVFHSSDTLNILCIFVYTVYYLCMVGYFMRYVNNYNFLLKSDEQNSAKKPIETALAIEDNSADSVPLTKVNEQFVERLREWVELKKYRDSNNTIDDILHELNTTRSSLNEYMVNHYGMNFRTWRNSLRIEEAKRLLEESDVPVASIHNAVGYTDRSNFHRNFTEIVGSTPKQYRNKHRGTL